MSGELVVYRLVDAQGKDHDETDSLSRARRVAQDEGWAIEADHYAYTDTSLVADYRPADPVPYLVCEDAEGVTVSPSYADDGLGLSAATSTAGVNGSAVVRYAGTDDDPGELVADHRPPLADHHPTYRVGGRGESNFVASCDCGWKCNIASASPEFAAKVAAEHLTRVAYELARWRS